MPAAGGLGAGQVARVKVPEDLVPVQGHLVNLAAAVDVVVFLEPALEGGAVAAVTWFSETCELSRSSQQYDGSARRVRESARKMRRCDWGRTLRLADA